MTGVEAVPTAAEDARELVSRNDGDEDAEAATLVATIGALVADAN